MKRWLKRSWKTRWCATQNALCTASIKQAAQKNTDNRRLRFIRNYRNVDVSVYRLDRRCWDESINAVESDSGKMPGLLLWQHEGSKRMSDYKLSNMAVSDGEKTCGRWISRRSRFILKKAELAQGVLRNRHRINTVWKGLQSYGKRTITNQKNRRSPRRLRAKYTQCTNQRFMRWVFRPAGPGQFRKLGGIRWRDIHSYKWRNCMM